MPICSAFEPSPLSRRALLRGLLTLSVAATGPSIAASSLPVTEIAPGVFVYQAPYEEADAANLGAIANLGFVIGSNSVAVIDSGGSRAAGLALLAAVRAHTDRPVSHVVNTHFHPDHILGNSAFPGAKIVAHPRMVAALEARGDFYLDSVRRDLGVAAAGTVVIAPDLLVDGELQIDLGERVLSIRSWPTEHSDSDITLRDLTSDSWFLGDLLFVRRMPTLDGSLRGWIRVLRRLQSQPAARVVPGHGPASVVWPASVEPLLAYLNGLAVAVRRAVAQGVTLAEAEDSVGFDLKDGWLLFDQGHPRNVAVAFAELEWE